mmetsp:Transcript_89777/g.187591  ORF Transcript_89777/g.187591 Transcript_89777/m.187591 type:complete len:352 (-) Transcript_89777:126-1181(-)
MTKGAVHPNGSSFRRVARLDVVQRMRRLVDSGMISYTTGDKVITRPRWLGTCEEIPPMENHNLNLQAKDVRSPYPQMLNFVLKKYPDMRFQDVYVDGNDWSVGNDTYRADHPAMQFVARQLKYMREENLSKWKAFQKTEDFFRKRRMEQEVNQKVAMASMLGYLPEGSTKSSWKPMFTTGQAYAQAEQARSEAAILDQIRMQLRKSKESAPAYSAEPEPEQPPAVQPVEQTETKTSQQEEDEMSRSPPPREQQTASVPSQAQQAPDPMFSSPQKGSLSEAQKEERKERSTRQTSSRPSSMSKSDAIFSQDDDTMTSRGRRSHRGFLKQDADDETAGTKGGRRGTGGGYEGD